MKYLVIGDVMLDCYARAKRVGAAEEQIPKYLFLEENELPGGAANVALLLSGLGETALCGAVNKQDKETFERLLPGVDLSLLSLTDLPTTTKARIYLGKTPMLRIDKDSLQKLGPQNNISRAVEETEVLVISDYDKGALASFAAQITPSNENMLLNKKIVANVKPANLDKVSGIITMNWPEFQTIRPGTLLKDLPAEAMSVKNMFGFKGLIVTAGKNGATYAGETAFHIPASKVHAKNIVGAGDAVVAYAAFYYDLLMTDPEKAMAFIMDRAGQFVSKARF